MHARCQTCGASELHWTVQQIAVHVGSLQNYKMQACEKCRYVIQQAIVKALEALASKESARE